MPRKTYKPEEFAGLLRDVESLTSTGKTISKAKRLKELEKGLSPLVRIVQYL